MAGLINRIVSWFSQEERAPAAVQAGGAYLDPDQADKSGLSADETLFRQRLKAVLGPRKVAQAGCVQFVGLDSLKDRLGPRWPAVRDRVHALADRLLRQMLSPADVYYGYGNETYVVVFANLEANQASLICAKLMQELQRVLLGEPDLSTIVVRTAARETSGDLVLKPERLADLLAKMASRARPTAVPETTREAVPSTAGTAKKVDGAVTGEMSAMAAPGQDGRGATSQPAAPADADPWAHLRPAMGPLEVVYRPAWDVKGQALGLYVASPRRGRPGRQHVYGYDTLATGGGSAGPGAGTGARAPQGTVSELQEILGLDREVMRQAVDAYLELYDNRFRYYLALPVHFETLAGAPRRRAYMELASHIPAHLYPFITYHLLGVPDGVPSSRLAEFVAALRHVGRAVMVRTEIAPHPFATFAAAGVKGVVLSLPPTVSRDRLIQDLYLTAAEARRRNLQVFVDGVDGAALESIAEEAGVNFMAGDLIGGWMDYPEHVTRLSRRDILENGAQLDR
ncbi:MAG: hypothetical protein PW843_29950 [Azospirillaceae bacterium]|nr:hypothetical protein [Azospirillaceae bacterium]